MYKEEFKVEEEEQKFPDVAGLKQAPDEIKMAVLGKHEILEQGYVSLSVTSDNQYVRIGINTPDGKQRVPNDIVCVLDISYSMNNEAHVKNNQGIKETHGLSYLDLLKHATKTIIANLKSTDRFSLISYSNLARLEFPLTFMTDENKELATIITDNMRPENNTNIWCGIELALEILRNDKKPGANQTIMLLTDGEPNIFPEGGYIKQLQDYKNKYVDHYFSMHTFAYGKKIDTPLLDQIATIGNGQYCFIPCPGFIGTIFVNALSNILNTMGGQCELHLEPINGAKIEKIPGGIPHKKNVIYVGDIKFGQTRDIIVKMNFPKGPADQDQQQYQYTPWLNVKIKYIDYVNQQLRIGESKQNLIQDWQDPFVTAHHCRTYFVDEVRQAIDIMKQSIYNLDMSLHKINQLSQYLKLNLEQLKLRKQQLAGKNNTEFTVARIDWSVEFLTNLKKDVDGEVTLAFRRTESFNHWGKHFLPSLNHAHLKQQCNNFIDPGIQCYGGKFFQQIRDQVEQTFLKLPAPKPSIVKNDNIQKQQRKQQKSYTQIYGKQNNQYNFQQSYQKYVKKNSIQNEKPFQRIDDLYKMMNQSVKSQSFQNKNFEEQKKQKQYIQPIQVQPKSDIKLKQPQNFKRIDESYKFYNQPAKNYKQNQNQKQKLQENQGRNIFEHNVDSFRYFNQSSQKLQQPAQQYKPIQQEYAKIQQPQPKPVAPQPVYQPKPQPKPQPVQPAQNNIDMGAYYNCGGGCFEGNGLVKMFNGNNKKVKDIQVGDSISGIQGEECKVKFVIEIQNEKKKMMMVEMQNRLLITPKHPILINDIWVKPQDIEKPKLIDCDMVYNFVLEKGHIININGIQCVTFGHEFQGDKVFHEYFGQQKIVDDLKKIASKQNGNYIHLNMLSFIRNKTTNSICGINDIKFDQ